MKRLNRIHKNQYGLVSFFVVVIIMIVLSLIVLAFAQLVRREQRQSLDRQLSTQAFYAAESGVNDAINALPDLIEDGTPWDPDCDGFIDAAELEGESDLGGGISYSCLLVDPSPPELVYDSIDIDESQATPIQSASGDPLQVIDISWEDPDGNTDIDGCVNPSEDSFPGSLPEEPDPLCQVGSLRLELVPFPTGASRTRDQLVGDRLIAFAQPQSGGINSLAYGSGSGDNQGVNVAGGCNNAGARYCTIRLTGLNSNRFYLRMRAIYSATAVTVRGYTDGAAANQEDLIGAQVEIDATGRANDVLRRIKVNRPLESSSTVSPEFGVQSADTLCKRFSIAPAPPGQSSLLEFDPSDEEECDPTD